MYILGVHLLHLEGALAAEKKLHEAETKQHKEKGVKNSEP